MSEKIIQEFISFLEECGLSPRSSSAIIADDKRHDYELASDKRGKKKGYFRLNIVDGFGYGYCGDWRNSDFFSWFSKQEKHFTAEEIAAYKSKRKEAEATLKAERENEIAAAKREAEDFLLFLDNADRHAYLEDKKVRIYGDLKLSGSDLIIPLGDKTGIYCYQLIKPDGGKYVLPASCRKTGSYFSLGGDESRIFIGEGYSTCATVRELTGNLTFMAIDAGNLINVAREIRGLYPDAPIVIAADNDHKSQGNKGLTSARAVKTNIENVEILYPQFTDDEKELSDWNDYCYKYGKEQTKRALSGVSCSEVSPASVINGLSQDNSQAGGGNTPYDPNWESGLVFDSKGNYVKNSSVNLVVLLGNHPTLRDIFKYDSFSKKIIVRNCPPWEDDGTFEVRPIYDYDYTRLECYMEGMFKIQAGADKCARAIDSVAMESRNTFNPAADYFNSLEWDGVPRINTWLSDYVSDGSQPRDYLTLVGRKFVCGLAARAMNAGIKFDTMVVLEGRQYAGKSYLSRILSTVHGVEYFLDDFKDIENKDTLMKMQGKLVVEFPEITAMRKAEINDLKAFLSRNEDVFRPPYGRNTITAKRQCVFIGTVNPEGPYLRDITGNRRYWPVACRDKIALDALKEIMPQLHAEAAHFIKQGEKLWLEDREYELCCVEQDKRVVTDVWIDKINEIVSLKSEISTDAILFELNIPTDKQTPLIQHRITQAMIVLGFHPCRLSVGSKRKRGFRKETNQTSIFDAKEEEISW